jgi:hypothetical protein
LHRRDFIPSTPFSKAWKKAAPYSQSWEKHRRVPSNPWTPTLAATIPDFGKSGMMPSTPYHVWKECFAAPKVC